MGGLTTVEDVDVGDRADRTASMELMSAMRLKVPVLAIPLSGNEVISVAFTTRVLEARLTILHQGS